jgi:hypothetical protein
MDSGHAGSAADDRRADTESASFDTTPSTPTELEERAIAYAKAVIDEFDLEIDLDAVDWTVDETDRRKRLAAQTVYPRIPQATVGEPLDWESLAQDPSCRVELTWNAFEALGWPSYTDTIRHELIHVEQLHPTNQVPHRKPEGIVI